MFEKFYVQDNGDGTCNIIVYADRMNEEISIEFLNGSLIKKALTAVKNKKRIMTVRAVKLIIAGGFVVSIPFSQFAARGTSEGAKYAMSYVYMGTASSQIADVNLSADVLNSVSPSYFELNSDGTLKTKNISQSFIDAMHSQNRKVVPFLSNGWNRQTGINALNNMGTLTDSIVQTINQYGLDGINVDLENLTEVQRNQYTLLIKTLREKLPPDKEVSIAVAANPWGVKTGWQGSYDYAGLSQYADHLLLMAYDEHYCGGTAGPVASIKFVEDSIRYALTLVPKEKIVVGIPFYGRLWSTDGTMKGEGISLKRISELAKMYPNKIFYDAQTGTPVLHITVTTPFTLNGKTIKVGNYAIWYENADTIKQKLTLVNKFNIKGAGNWSAGQETADVWDYYELWLNGHYFSDIRSNFAKDDILKLT